MNPTSPQHAHPSENSSNAHSSTFPLKQTFHQAGKPVYIKSGHKLGKAEYLFTKIDEKKAEEWREHYGGNQAERIQKQKEEAAAQAKKQAQKEKAKAKKAEKKKRGWCGEECEGRQGYGYCK